MPTEGDMEPNNGGDLLEGGVYLFEIGREAWGLAPVRIRSCWANKNQPVDIDWLTVY